MDADLIELRLEPRVFKPATRLLKGVTVAQGVDDTLMVGVQPGSSQSPRLVQGFRTLS
jgi:hypothetical protein